MQRKKVNGNIIGARWQDIRHRGEIIAVNRRIGGLENYLCSLKYSYCVNRRIGGLEIWLLLPAPDGMVNRRIGGLEIIVGGCPLHSKVNRRIGGLEIQCTSLS